MSDHYSLILMINQLIFDIVRRRYKINIDKLGGVSEFVIQGLVYSQI